MHHYLGREGRGLAGGAPSRGDDLKFASTTPLRAYPKLTGRYASV